MSVPTQTITGHDHVAEPTTAPSPVRSWLRRIIGGGQIIETCPAWCTDSHQNDTTGHLDDLVHGVDFPGMHLPVHDAEHGTLAMPVLAARLQVDPYSEDEAQNVPHVLLFPDEDADPACLGPDEFAAAIAAVRAHCDRLDQVHAQLVEAASR